MKSEANLDREIHVIFHGKVQGVGFRATLRRYALHYHLVGTAKNLSDGSVEVYVQGERTALYAFIQAVLERPRGARITNHTLEESDPQTLYQAFLIIH